MPEQPGSLLVDDDQPLIGVMVQKDGRTMIRYLTDERELDQLADQASIDRALSLAGAWADLDWEEAEAELERIRSESLPTPPITDL